MKRGLLVIAVPLLVAVGLFVLLSDQSTGTNAAEVAERSVPASDSSDAAPVDSTSNDPVVPRISVDADTPAAPSDARPATIDRLADGDSFDIRWSDNGDSDEVRLLGLNAPEGDACFGPEARDMLHELTNDAELRIQSMGRDDFGRVLGNVWVDDVFVNVAMVEMGGALALSDGGNHTALIQDAVSFASANNLGLWDPAFCGASSEAELVIGFIEADAPGPDNENPNGEWIEIVNLAAVDADMTDWSIRDESTRHRFFFPDNFVLTSSNSVRIFSGCGDDNATSLYWCDGDSVWNNGGDTGFLVDPEGRFADTLSYDR